MIRTIFVLYVPDDFSAPGFAEVDIEIGHRHAFRIKEALEKQTQSERVEIGDGERPGNYRARARPAARAHRNIIVLRSEEHTSELQSLMRISYAVFCLKKNKKHKNDKIKT